MESNHSCCQMLKLSLSKLVMEAVGTMLFTMFFTSLSQPVILLGLWITNIFMWKISGSHFNPAVTFAYLFRRDESQMKWDQVLAYCVAQTLGAFVGALLVNFYTFDLFELTYQNDFFLRALIQEGLSSFMYVFFFMTNTDQKLLFSEEPAINCFILSSAYIGARTMFYGNMPKATSYGAVMNPAVAIGIQMSTLLNNGFSAWNSIYLYPTIPFGASFLAVLFYELIYKKTRAILDHEEDSDGAGVHDDNMGEHD